MLTTHVLRFCTNGFSYSFVTTWYFLPLNPVGSWPRGCICSRVCARLSVMEMVWTSRSPSVYFWEPYGVAHTSSNTWWAEWRWCALLQNLCVQRVHHDSCSRQYPSSKLLYIRNDKKQAAIVAQIAITGLSLNFLSQTHWVARTCFVLSLTFALMAVYYSTTQQRTLGRLLKAKGVYVYGLEAGI